MKTPDKIKKGLEFGKENCANAHDCIANCPYNAYCGVSAYKGMTEIPQEMVADALAYIKQLERERNAALHDMHQLQGAICAYCKNLYRPNGANHCECKEFGDLSKIRGDEDFSPLICGKFTWRGVCEENNPISQEKN